MSKHPAPEPASRDLAALLKVLGEANRLSIVLAIGLGKRSVSELIEATALPQTLVSFHLRVLRRSNLVRTVRDGAFIFYSLAEPALLGLLAELSARIAGRAAAPGDGQRG